MLKKIIATAAVAAVVVLGLSLPAEAKTPAVSYAKVSILHAVPNTPVDVYINHHRFLQNFQPGSLNGAFRLKAGTDVVTITAANSANDSAPVIGPAKLKFVGGKNYTLVAHLTAAGAPTASLYLNDLHAAKKGKGRLMVRHDAAAPAVDILANNSVLIAGLTNPKQKSLDVAAGTYSVKVNLAGTSTTAIGPANVTIKKGYATIVYAWGSAADGNLTVAVQNIALQR